MTERDMKPDMRASALDVSTRINLCLQERRGMAARPKVTVLMPTYNRPDYLPDAVLSVVRQDFGDWELLVINDGGVDVRHIVEGLRDPRIVYVDRPRNAGKSACLNYGLRHARGDYVAYLDDDDAYRPYHLSRLVEALDANPGCGGAYSDACRAVFVRDASGSRHVVERVCEPRAEHNRNYLYYTNYVYHVCLMHRRELAIRAGGYDERVRLMIDWNMARKLSLLTGLVHVPAMTVDFYVPARRDSSDRISDAGRGDRDFHDHNLRMIRGDLPPEPWRGVAKAAVVLPVSRWDAEGLSVIRYFTDKLAHPCRIVLVNRDPSLTPHDCRRLMGPLADGANLRVVNSPRGSDLHAAYLTAAGCEDADYYYLATMNADTTAALRLMRALGYMAATGCRAVRWECDGDTSPYDIMVERDLLKTIGPTWPETPRIPDDWYPGTLGLDMLFWLAGECERTGNVPAARHYLSQLHGFCDFDLLSSARNQLWARVAFQLGDYATAQTLCSILVARGFGADNWARLGRIRQGGGDYAGAADAYRRALNDIGLADEAVRRGSVKQIGAECDAFRAMLGLGECLMELDTDDEAARVLRLAGELHSGDLRPYLAFARLFLKHDDLASAEQALYLARERDTAQKTAVVDAGLAELYERRNEPLRAYQWIRRALDTAPDNADYVEKACRLSEMTGREADMEGPLRRFLDYRPGHIAALADLATICRRSGRREEALRLARQAVELRHGAESLSDGLGASLGARTVGGAPGVRTQK